MEGQLNEQKSESSIVGAKGMIIWNPYDPEPFNDDIIMKQSGIIGEVSLVSLNQIFGQDIKEVFKSR